MDPNNSLPRRTAASPAHKRSHKSIAQANTKRFKSRGRNGTQQLNRVKLPFPFGWKTGLYHYVGLSSVFAASLFVIGYSAYKITEGFDRLERIDEAIRSFPSRFTSSRY
jgi:hypothetical protein